MVSVLFNEPKLLKCTTNPPAQAIPRVSVLFNEPKLLKSTAKHAITRSNTGFSALQRAEIAEIRRVGRMCGDFRQVSVLFNEPKLLKYEMDIYSSPSSKRFSALQRAEIAEILGANAARAAHAGFSALQRAEIAEMADQFVNVFYFRRFQCSSTSRNC